ncbi:MAG: ABC transporter permease [Thermomicrobiaceae bacterium]
METSRTRDAGDADSLRDTGSRKGFLKRIGPQSRWYWARQMLENPVAVGSMIFILLVVAAAFIWPLLSENYPFRLNPVGRLEGPSADFLMGTDQFGRDVLLRGVFGARISLAIGLSVMMMSGILGALIGLIAGYYPRLDTPIMRVMDGIMAFPPILLAIAVMASLGPSTGNVIFTLGVVYTPIISRLVRGSTLSVKQQLYVEAAQSIGVKDFGIMIRHIFPNTLSPLIVQCTFIVALAIIAEASLSFLGAGVPPEVPTWGAMLKDGQTVISRAWWMITVPGLLLFATVLAINLIGDALRDAIDPRSRQR